MHILFICTIIYSVDLLIDYNMLYVIVYVCKLETYLLQCIRKSTVLCGSNLAMKARDLGYCATCRHVWCAVMRAMDTEL